MPIIRSHDRWSVTRGRVVSERFSLNLIRSLWSVTSALSLCSFAQSKTVLVWLVWMSSGSAFLRMTVFEQPVSSIAVSCLVPMWTNVYLRWEGAEKAFGHAHSKVGGDKGCWFDDEKCWFEDETGKSEFVWELPLPEHQADLNNESMYCWTSNGGFSCEYWHSDFLWQFLFAWK